MKKFIIKDVENNLYYSIPKVLDQYGNDTDENDFSCWSEYEEDAFLCDSIKHAVLEAGATAAQDIPYGEIEHHLLTIVEIEVPEKIESKDNDDEDDECFVY
jgi:hypothetical protein